MMKLTPIIDPTNVYDGFMARRLRQMQPKECEITITIHGAAGPQRFFTAPVVFNKTRYRRVRDAQTGECVGHYSPTLTPREACEIAYFDMHSSLEGVLS